MSELYKAACALLNSVHCDKTIDREKALRCGDSAVAAASRIARLEERLRAALDEAIRCQLVSVDFDPTNPEGHRYYGVEATLRSGDSSKQWRAGNYLLIPVNYAYELLSSVCEAEND